MKYEDIIQQGLDNSTSKENNDLMIQATITFYLEMKAKIESGDPVQVAEAKKRTAEIQALLNARRNALCEMTGLSPDQMAAVNQHPRFKEHEIVTQARATLKEALHFEPRKKQRKGHIKA